MLICLYLNIACTWVEDFEDSPQKENNDLWKNIGVISIPNMTNISCSKCRSSSLGDSAEMMTLPLSQPILHINANTHLKTRGKFEILAFSKVQNTK